MILTVKLMKVLELRFSCHCVVEMGLQSTTLQEAVSHLCQVDPNNGIRVPGIWRAFKFSLTMCARHFAIKYQIQYILSL